MNVAAAARRVPQVLISGLLAALLAACPPSAPPGDDDDDDDDDDAVDDAGMPPGLDSGPITPGDDGGGGTTDGGGVVDPDGGVVAPDDAGVVVDPDAAPVPPDAAPEPPDAAPEPPDDCDADGPIHPGADEVLDGVDNDCDGLIDEITACAAGGTPYQTISAAIAAAPDGGTIYVCAGVYPEHLVVAGKSLTIIAIAGAATTIIDGGGIGPVVNVQATGGTGVVLEGFTIRNGHTTAQGGGVRCQNSPLRLTASVVIGNSADGGGGLYADTCTLDVNGTSFRQNSGGEYGGGALLVASSGLVRNGELTDNDAVFGGGLKTVEGNVSILSNVFAHNTALLRGGGLYHESSGTISGNTFSVNDAQWTGGGMYLMQHGPLVSNNVVDGNTSANDGGGIYVHQGAAHLLSNTVTNNSSADDGGGIRVFEASAIIEANIVENNTAGDGGGGMRISHVPSELIDNIVRNNVATNTGGGLDLDNDASYVHGGEITGNSASSGGGIFTWLAPWTGTRLENIVIADNWAWRGAGIFADDNFQTLRMTGLTITGNTANKGGGLHIRSTNYILSHSIFEDNEAVRGGAIYTELHDDWTDICPCPPVSPTGTISYVVFHDNNAPDGAALWSNDPGLTVQSSIVVENLGTAVMVPEPAPVPEPETPADPPADPPAPDPTPGPVPGPPHWRYNDVWPATYSGMADLTGIDGNLSFDPMFADAAADDFHLQAGSPCIDAGNPSVLDMDGSRSDMGRFGGPL